MKLIPVLCSICISVYAANVSADWVEFGASYKCDENEFSILPIVDIEEDGVRTAVVPILLNYSEIEYGNHELHCKLKTGNIFAVVEVDAPSEKGMCMGSGHVHIARIELNGKIIFTEPHAFNWYCPGTADLINKVSVSSSGSIEVCRAKDWGSGGYIGTTCITTSGEK